MLHVSVQDRRDAELVGRAGVRALAAGESEKMVALLPLTYTAGLPYELVPLTATAGLERPIPSGWICTGPTSVSNEFRAYLGPLVGELQHYAPPLTNLRY
jgi:hypothetical protein